MFEIQRLHWWRRHILARSEKERIKAEKAKDHAQIQRIAAEAYYACNHVDQRIDWILDQRIRQKAQELDIAMPLVTQNEMWQRGEDQSLYLSPQGRFYLRKLIDEEKARRFEVWAKWVKLLTPIILGFLTALVGIIGAITGLVAVLRHTK